MKERNAIDANQLVLKADIQEQTRVLLEAIQKIAGHNLAQDNGSPRYLRTRDVRKLLGVSPNKLSDMRFKGEIPFKKIGKTYFYPQDKIYTLFSK